MWSRLLATRTTDCVWLVSTADTHTHMASAETDAYAALDDEGAETSVVNAPKEPTKDSETDEQVCFYHTQPVPTGEDHYDGVDNYGNPVEPKGGSTTPNATLRKRKLRSLPETPPWANAPHTLPTQPYSYAGMAAFAISRSDAPLLLPQSSTEVDPKVVDTVLAELNLAPKNARRPLPMANSPQTRIFQDGYSAAHTLTVLQIASELSALMRAEACELNNAANGTPSPDGMLAPRSIAITVLSTSPSPTLTPNQLCLLDAIAFLAAEESTDDDAEHAVGKGVRAASQLRIAFLYGECAKPYVMKRYDSGIEVLHSKSETLRVPCNEVCVTWIEDVPVEDGSVHRAMRSEFATLAHADTAQGYVDALRESVFKLWRDNNLVPSTPMRLLGSYSDCRLSPTNAYARHRLACARAFFTHLEPYLEAERSSYVTNHPSYSGSLEWTQMYAKIVPHGMALDGPNTSHGIIVHQHGFGTQTREFIERVRHEEEEQHVKPPIGLRRPIDTTEEANCVHVLMARAEQCHLASHLTCFGLRSVAGESFGRSLPKLAWRLVPLTSALNERVFILPCEKISIFNCQYETNEPLAQSTDRAVCAYAHLFPNTFSSGVMTDSALSPLPDIVTRDPTPHETVIKTLLGLPLTCKAFRIGDVANALQSLTSNSAPPEAEVPSCLSSFFVSAAASLGSEESVEDAFMWASTQAERVVVREEENKKLSGRVEELELALKVAKAISSPAPTDATAAEEPTTGTTEPETATNDPAPPDSDTNPTELDADRLAKLLHSWKRSADFSGALCYTLKAPIQGKSTRMVLASLAAAAPEVDASIQQTTCEWAKTHCCKKTMGDCDRIARTCHHALTLAGQATGDHRRAFLVCTSKTADAVTTILDIDLDKPTGEDCWKTIDWSTDDGWGCSTEVARRAVVLAWFSDERGLAVLPVCDTAEDEDDAQ